MHGAESIRKLLGFFNWRIKPAKRLLDRRKNTEEEEEQKNKKKT